MRLERFLGAFPVKERLLLLTPSTARFASNHPLRNKRRFGGGMGRRTLWGTRSSATDSGPRSLGAWPRGALPALRTNRLLMNSSLAPPRQPGGPQRISCNKMDDSRLEAAKRTSQCVCLYGSTARYCMYVRNYGKLWLGYRRYKKHGGRHESWRRAERRRGGGVAAGLGTIPCTACR